MRSLGTSLGLCCRKLRSTTVVRATVVRRTHTGAVASRKTDVRSVLQGLVPHLEDSPVLVSGRNECLAVAREYGFARAVSTAQLAAHHAHAIAPFSSVQSREKMEEIEGVPCPVRV